MANAMPKTKANNEPYRKVKITMWDDPKFRALSPLPPSGQSLFIYLLTGPFTGIIPGLFKAGRAALAEELNWDVEAFDLALDEAISLGLVKADLQARVFWLPNAAKHNPPGSINVVKSWAKAFEYLPECSLKWEAWLSLKSACYGVSEAMGKSFDMAMPLPKDKPTPLPSGIQKAVSSKQVLKDQNILPEAGKNQHQASEKIFISLPLSDGKSFFDVTESYLREQIDLYPGVNIEQELRNMRGWLDSNPTKRKTLRGIKRFITTWLQNSQDKPRGWQGSRTTGSRDVNVFSQPDNKIPGGFRG